MACSAIKLRECGCLAAKPYGHRNILDVAREIWVFLTDHSTRKTNRKRNFAVSFPTKAEWKTGNVSQIYEGYDQNPKRQPGGFLLSGDNLQAGGAVQLSSRGGTLKST